MMCSQLKKDGPYLLDFLLVTFLERGDVGCTLLGFLDLLPRLHLLLLEQGNSVGEQLSVSLNTILNKEA